MQREKPCITEGVVMTLWDQHILYSLMVTKISTGQIKLPGVLQVTVHVSWFLASNWSPLHPLMLSIRQCELVPATPCRAQDGI